MITPVIAVTATPHLVSLPSPLAPLSASPPLEGGARSSGEGPPHRIAAVTRVTVSVDRNGAPFAIRALQRLDVRRVGDYSFSIGAPVMRVQVAPGSQSSPGLRTGAILWAGFDPGRRLLAADAELDPAAAAPSLPLQIERRSGRLTLRNATSIDVTAFTGDAQPAELLATLAAFRRAVSTGTPAVGGFAMLTSAAKPIQVRISAPLEVTGTIGSKRVRVVLGGSRHPEVATFPDGEARLVVRTLSAPGLLQPAPHEAGRALLARTIRASLELARARQYDAFLGNPDPGGSSATSYRYVSGTRPTPVAEAPAAGHGGRGRQQTLLWAAATLAALAVAVVVWSRS